MRTQTFEAIGIQLFAIVAILEGARIVIAYQEKLDGPQAGGYVAILGAVLLSLGILLLVLGIRRGPEKPTNWGDRESLGRVLLALGLAVGYVSLIGFLGYLLITAIFFIAYLRLFSSYPWPWIVICSVLGAIGSSYMWAELGMTLPRGLIPWP